MLKENAYDDRSQKVAVITGSSKGVGKAIAVEFAKEGYKIVLNARDETSYLKR
jgi:short-subunit dehydrogenase